ncbi:MAG TPA: SprB repeat-containing protein, partial [Chitinophagales bacterium]|nr:SprB repeat-containing protein [Chitinophagales bacterium]
MKRSLHYGAMLLLCFGITISTRAQNLVLNPSFETTSSCPNGISEFNLATNWNNTCTGGSDTCSTPDLYAGCCPGIGGANSPNGLLGYQASRTGTHHAGLILGDGFVGCVTLGDNYREYLEGQLSTPLVAGQHYLVRFYVSLPEGVMFASNSIGVYFTNSQYQHVACPNSIINVTPQLEMCGPAITDTVNWVPIQWIYVATGGEQYFTIGNFHNDGNTNYVSHNCQSFNPYIYYYVDDVNISPAGPNDCSFTLTLDSVKATCGASDGRITTNSFGCTTPFSYHWSTGATTANLTNVASGSYTVTVTDASNCAQTALASISNNTFSATITASNPSCGSSNGSATANGVNGTGPYTYHWNNGNTTQSISSLGAGAYNVTVTGAAGCSATAGVSLLGASGITLAPTATDANCGSSNGTATVAVSGGSAPYTYSWSNGQTTQSISGLSAGNYTVTVQGDTTSAAFWTEDFTSGGTGWTLNTAGSGTNGSSANQWVVNSDNNCTCGSGNYLHVTVSANSSCLSCLLMQGQCTYLALASIFNQGDFTTDKLAVSPTISTIGKANITLTFNYEVLGNATDYGLVPLSSDGGATWTALPTHYNNTNTCSTASVNIPTNYQNIANFKIAFEWINAAGTIGGSQGDAPGFVIDNVALKAGSTNCPATANVTVGNSGGLTASISSTSPSCGLNNGSATANVTAGTGPYTYSWNSGATTQTISNLGAGVYNVTVSNGGGCSATATVSLFVGSGISALANSTNATCGNNNGTAFVTVSPSNGVYNFQWSNSHTTDTITGLAAGNYTVTVTGSGGCTATASVS